MIQVSYVSRTSEPMSSEQLLELLLQCRNNNREKGITGMLLYANGTFLQAIEGDEYVIDELVSQIEKDDRHNRIQILGRRTIEQREFADWTMGFERLTDEALADIEGLSNFGCDDFNFDNLTGNAPVISALMDHYREPHFDIVMGEIEAKDKVIKHLTQLLAQAREHAQVSRLALEGVTEALRKGDSPDSILRFCQATLQSTRLGKN